MITKELLSEVLKEEVIHCFMISGDDNEVYYRHDGTIGTLYINIYELAFRCKEWARNIPEYHESLFVSSGNDENYFCHLSFGLSLGITDRTLYSNVSEPEAIFKACEYILKQLSNK